MKTAIVTTTIYVPRALENYARNAAFHGHEDFGFIVIGDRKTPSETADFCASLARNYPCEYLAIEDQRSYLERFPELWHHLPFDSIQRRNVGLLKAWESGAEVIITIDDDNWVLSQDFLGCHEIVGHDRELPSVSSTSGWYNVCSVLEEANHTPFYHRGYPTGQRWKETEAFLCHSQIRRKVAVNAGLWLDDPDIDALTRLNRILCVRGIRPGVPQTLALQPGTWSPFNSQNTALMRDVIPAYFLSPCVGRYDDIWPSYIVTRIAEHLGHVITYGCPLVRQERNVHDLWRDLDAERNGMLMTDDLCLALRSVTLRGTSYQECYAEIAAALPGAWTPGPKWSDSMKEWRDGLLEGISMWSEVFRRLTYESPRRDSSVMCAQPSVAEIAALTHRISDFSQNVPVPGTIVG